MNKNLHIITFDVPYPPNYGGAIDVFYRIKSLSEKGVNIILHCSEYRRAEENMLNKYCSKVFYYQRKLNRNFFFRLLPFSVISRKNNSLLQNILSDDYPILFEGLVSCSYIDHPSIEKRNKFFREANIEHHYYYNLSKATKSIAKKAYFLSEALKLFFFQRKIKKAKSVFAISTSDSDYLLRKYPELDVRYIPCFHPNEDVISKEGKSDYILYHANLSVAENYKVAEYLIKNVFSKLNHKCVIAGMNPPKFLLELSSKYSNVRLVVNPEESEMNELIINAHIITLLTFQSTGMKIKLLRSLCEGRYIIANDKMTKGSGLDELCFLSNSANDTINLINNLMLKQFAIEEVEKRKEIIFPEFSNNYMADKIISYIYS
jgi:hypothetical protein